MGEVEGSKGWRVCLQCHGTGEPRGGEPFLGKWVAESKQHLPVGESDRFFPLCTFEPSHRFKLNFPAVPTLDPT